MADTERFQSDYLALLAVAWDDLEQIAEHLGRAGDGEPDEGTLSRLEVFRLEFLLFDGWSREFAAHANQRDSSSPRIGTLILNLEKMLDTDNAQNAGALRQRVLLAQDWLYDEVRSLTNTEHQARSAAGVMTLEGVFPAQEAIVGGQ